MSRKKPRRDFDYTHMDGGQLARVAERLAGRRERVELELIKLRMVYVSCSRPGDLRTTLRAQTRAKIRALIDQQERLRLKAAALRIAQEGRS